VLNTVQNFEYPTICSNVLVIPKGVKDLMLQNFISGAGAISFSIHGRFRRNRTVEQILGRMAAQGPNVRSGLNSHYFHVGEGHQPNSRGLYTVRIPI